MHSVSAESVNSRGCDGSQRVTIAAEVSPAASAYQRPSARRINNDVSRRHHGDDVSPRAGTGPASDGDRNVCNIVGTRFTAATPDIKWNEPRSRNVSRPALRDCPELGRANDRAISWLLKEARCIVDVKLQSNPDGPSNCTATKLATERGFIARMMGFNKFKGCLESIEDFLEELGNIRHNARLLNSTASTCLVNLVNCSFSLPCIQTMLSLSKQYTAFHGWLECGAPR